MAVIDQEALTNLAGDRRSKTWSRVLSGLLNDGQYTASNHTGELSKRRQELADDSRTRTRSRGL